MDGLLSEAAALMTGTRLAGAHSRLGEKKVGTRGTGVADRLDWEIGRPNLEGWLIVLRW